MYYPSQGMVEAAGAAEKELQLEPDARSQHLSGVCSLQSEVRGITPLQEKLLELQVGVGQALTFKWRVPKQTRSRRFGEFAGRSPEAVWPSRHERITQPLGTKQSRWTLA